MGTLGNFSDGMGWNGMGAKLGSKSGIRWEGRELQGWIDGILQRKSPFAVFCKQKQRFIRNRPNKWGFVQQTKGLHQPKGWDLSNRSK